MTPWEKKKERGSIIALKLVLLIYKALGKKIVSALLYPVVLYFFLTDATARRASLQYLKIVHENKNADISSPKLALCSYRHFLSFGRKILHSISAWLGEFSADDIIFNNKDQVFAMADKGEGGLILSAHIGCLEVCRAAKRSNEKIKIVPLMYIENGLKYRTFLKTLDPESEQEVITIEEGKLDVPMQVLSRIQKGEFVSILADRLSPFSKDRSIELEFLGKPAKFPEGPFAMAYALNCPILTFFTVYDETLKQYKAFWNTIDTSDIVRSRKNREENLKKIAIRYLTQLEAQTMKYPYQWFNFFDFWE